MNCRSISPETWEHVRQCLIFYFSRRHGVTEAEDLTHETLLALWHREDFEFEREEDFPRVCYAFAGRVSKAGYRATQKHAYTELDPELAMPDRAAGGLKEAELGIYVSEVLHLAQSRLGERDRALLEQSMEPAERSENGGLTAGEASNMRVYLHRARKKLARITGWRKDKV